MNLHFCSTCLGRGSQLRTVLPMNLVLALPFRSFVKFHVALFSGTAGNEAEHSGLVRWVKEEFVDCIEMGLLVVAECKKEYWNASECKNTAHQMAMSHIDGERVPFHGEGCDSVQPCPWECDGVQPPRLRRCPA